MHLFLCDSMLGSLCRWLRFAGFDSRFAGVEMEKKEIIRLCQREGRRLLSKDRRLVAQGTRSLLIRSLSLEDQLVEVFGRLDLRLVSSLRFSRCACCNGSLEEVEKSGLIGVVPPHVLETVDSFRRCTDCKRVYWAGSHTLRIRARLEEISRRLEEAG